MDPKLFWQSKRFWGLVLMAVGSFIGNQELSNAGVALFGVGALDASGPVAFALRK